jgi:xanthine/CO dehydrogenase XdhC/CoxF family maturation factor
VNLARLKKFLEARRECERPVAMATVVATEGSTYSKTGALMLIDEHGIFQGMLSGGCLEGDLAIRAQQVIESGRPQLVTYDLGSDNDELWGLGVGCDGLMQVLLQPLTVSAGYEPCHSIFALMEGRDTFMVSSVVASSSAAAALASCVLSGTGSSRTFGRIGAEIVNSLQADAAIALSAGKTHRKTYEVAADNVEILHCTFQPVPRLLVLGAGLDAEPMVRFAAELGWKTTVVDHRPAYLEKADFSLADEQLCCAADCLQKNTDLGAFDLAIIMSHHLASDRSYLRQLAASGIGYIGLLGPPARRERLVAETGTAAALEGRLHGPAGIDIGGRGPAAIALSIVAEMQSTLQRG